MSPDKSLTTPDWVAARNREPQWDMMKKEREKMLPKKVKIKEDEMLRRDRRSGVKGDEKGVRMCVS